MNDQYTYLKTNKAEVFHCITKDEDIGPIPHSDEMIVVWDDNAVFSYPKYKLDTVFLPLDNSRWWWNLLNIRNLKGVWESSRLMASFFLVNNTFIH